MICHLHYFSHREAILQKAWEAGTIEFNGVQLKILPDLSSATLQRRALLQLILDRVKDWGGHTGGDFPFQCLLGKVRVHSGYAPDLPYLFLFLETEPFEVPDWMQLNPRIPRA